MEARVLPREDTHLKLPFWKNKRICSQFSIFAQVVLYHSFQIQGILSASLILSVIQVFGTTRWILAPSWGWAATISTDVLWLQSWLGASETFLRRFSWSITTKVLRECRKLKNRLSNLRLFWTTSGYSSSMLSFRIPNLNFAGKNASFFALICPRWD